MLTSLARGCTKLSGPLDRKGLKGKGLTDRDNERLRPLDSAVADAYKYHFIIPTGIVWYEGISTIYLWNHGCCGSGIAGGVSTYTGQVHR